MSVRLDTSTDTLRKTLGAALTIGAGAYSIGTWVKLISDVGATSDLTLVADQVNPTASSGFFTESDGTTIDADNFFGNVGPSITTVISTWYWLVIGRDGSDDSIHYRLFDDSGTLIQDNTSGTSTASVTTMDTILVGDVGSGHISADAELTLFKIHTGVYWSDAEAILESQKFGIQTAGGTDRFCWGLETITADQFGINEYSGSGENLTNSGAVNGATRPTQLEAAGGGAATLDQSAFRFYNDDDDENSATPAAAENAALTAPAGETRRIRVQVDATGDPATKAYKLQFRKAAGTWADVVTGVSV